MRWDKQYLRVGKRAEDFWMSDPSEYTEVIELSPDSFQVLSPTKVLCRYFLMSERQARRFEYSLVVFPNGLPTYHVLGELFTPQNHVFQEPASYWLEPDGQIVGHPRRERRYWHTDYTFRATDWSLSQCVVCSRTEEPRLYRSRKRMISRTSDSSASVGPTESVPVTLAMPQKEEEREAMGFPAEGAKSPAYFTVLEAVSRELVATALQQPLTQAMVREIIRRIITQMAGRAVVQMAAGGQPVMTVMEAFQIEDAILKLLLN